MNQYNNQNPYGYNYQPQQQPQHQWQQPSQSLDMRVSAVMKKVYVKMTAALVVSALAAFLVPVFFPNITYMLMTNNWIYWGCAIVELLLVFAISGSLKSMTSQMSTLLFYIFALVNGITMSIIFVAFSPESILKTFLITAGVFGAMSVYGYFTTRDLTKIGSFLMMALFGLIICLVVNLFWSNGTLGWIISAAGVLIFIGLTAYDTWQIKKMATMGAMSDQHLATWGALSLYLDFINLFIYLLRFFGSSRN